MTQKPKKECFIELNKKFPSSTRVKRLKALAYEAEGNYPEANTIYEEIIDDDPVDMGAYKRQVCILKAMGETDKAMAKLNVYLKTFSSDENAWNELNDLYIMTGKYHLAKFCQEELLLINPDNYAYHIQYAETLYTLKNVSEARTYYAQALELKPGCLRALYGLVLCLKVKGAKAGFHADLYKWATEQTLSCYREAHGNHGKDLTPAKVLQEQGITARELPAHLPAMLKATLEM